MGFTAGMIVPPLARVIVVFWMRKKKGAPEDAPFGPRRGLISCWDEVERFRQAEGDVGTGGDGSVIGVLHEQVRGDEPRSDDGPGEGSWRAADGRADDGSGADARAIFHAVSGG